jgi:LmbE family N-acetylglucosaminyl deacetylase
MAPKRLFSGPDDARIRRALVIAAHPDDVDFFAAGTVVLLTRRGVVVDLVLATSGDKGTRDGAVSGAELAAMREREQLASAERLGAGSVEFLHRRGAASSSGRSAAAGRTCC